MLPSQVSFLFLREAPIAVSPMPDNAMAFVAGSVVALACPDGGGIAGWVIVAFCSKPEGTPRILYWWSGHLSRYTKRRTGIGEHKG